VKYWKHVRTARKFLEENILECIEHGEFKEYRITEQSLIRALNWWQANYKSGQPLKPSKFIWQLMFCFCLLAKRLNLKPTVSDEELPHK